MIPSDEFIKNCNVTKEDWQRYLDKGTLEHIISNMLITYYKEQSTAPFNNKKKEISYFTCICK